MSSIPKEKAESFSEMDQIRSGSTQAGSSNIWHSFRDSFKPALREETLTSAHVSEKEYEEMDDVQRAAVNASNSQLKRDLKGRHLNMIALGSSIGTGLFVGLGQSLHTGGPGGIVIAWVIIATAIYATMQGVGELAIAFPISGSFNIYASRFLAPSIGCAIGYNYFLQFLVLEVVELVAASLTIKYWNSSLNPDIFVAIFWVTVLIITLLGVRWYGEAEFIFCLIKVITVIGFIILGIVLVCGGGPNHEFIGGKYWRNPGPFANGFKGVCSVFVTAAFSFGGTEMLALGAAEATNPSKSIGKAIKQVFWRITIFYVGTLTIIACLIPYNDKRLLGSSSVDASASPFVVAIVNGGVKGLPSVINAVILIAVLSVGNASVYATSRSLASLAEQGMFWKWGAYVDRKGRPLFAILLTNTFALLAFIATSDKQTDVFNWLMALSGLSSIFTWMSINASHIRFRKAMKVQNRSLSELSFKAQSGIWGSYYGFIINALVLVAQFWIALFPIGGKPNAYDFFLSYLGMPVLLFNWFIYMVVKKDWRLFIRSKDIDLDTGRLEVDIDLLQQEEAEEREYLATKSFIYRIYKKLT